MGGIHVSLTINTSNLDKLTAMPAKLGDAVYLGIERVALLFRDNCVLMAQAGHPEHPNVVTGRLSASMQYRMLGSGESASAEVGSNASYAAYVELGHMSPNWGDPSKGWHAVPAYPWFQPAIDLTFNSGDAQQLFTETVKEVLGV